MILGGVLLAASSASVFANADCEYVSAEKVGKVERERGDHVYEFQAKTTCSLSASGLSASQVETEVFKALKEHGSVSGVKKGVSFKDMPGKNFTFEDERYNTGHGHIQVTFNSYLVSGENSVLYSAKSSNIDADSFAENTKEVSIQAEYTISGDEVTVSIIKKAHVKKPHLPGFERGTIAGLTEEMEEKIVPIFRDALNKLSSGGGSQDL